MTAVSIIVAVVLFTIIAQNIGTVTTTSSITNASFTMPANATWKELTPCAQKNISAVVIYNYTNNTGDVATPLVTYGANVTVVQGISNTSGVLASMLYFDCKTCAAVNAYKVNVTCDFEPAGYIEEGGARAVAGLIVIFFALGIAVITLVPTLRSKVLDMVK